MTEMEYIRNRIREHMNSTADHLSTGGCDDHEQYQYCCGMIKAFATIEREIIDLEERINKAE
tara:strand:+ start:4961 stop:5146 length:186 start_codon:yes stop_codon:yes gene_type:complete